jgi:hypothetical protein
VHFERKKLRLLERNRFLFEKLFVNDSLTETKIADVIAAG